MGTGRRRRVRSGGRCGHLRGRRRTAEGRRRGGPRRGGPTARRRGRDGRQAGRGHVGGAGGEPDPDGRHVRGARRHARPAGGDAARRARAEGGAEPRGVLVRRVRGGDRSHDDLQRHAVGRRVARRPRDGHGRDRLCLPQGDAELRSDEHSAAPCDQGGGAGGLLRRLGLGHLDGLAEAGRRAAADDEHPACLPAARRLGLLRVRPGHPRQRLRGGVGLALPHRRRVLLARLDHLPLLVPRQPRALHRPGLPERPPRRRGADGAAAAAVPAAGGRLLRGRRLGVLLLQRPQLLREEREVSPDRRGPHRRRLPGGGDRVHERADDGRAPAGRGLDDG